MKKTILSLSLLACSLSFFSCHNKESNKIQKCGPDVVCAQYFAMVKVHLIDDNGQNVTLDSFYTTRKSTGTIIHINQQPSDGLYTILDDSYNKTLQNTKDTFVFTGIKNAKSIVSSTFVIGADCCHIQKTYGDDQVTVTP